MTEEKKTTKKAAAKKPIDIDMDVYERVVFLTLDKELRKNKALTKDESEELAKLEKLAFTYDGKKALKTATYRVRHETIRLVKGLPTPQSVIDKFSKDAQKKLFS